MAITAFRVCLHPYERHFSESVTPVLIIFIVSFGISFVNTTKEQHDCSYCSYILYRCGQQHKERPPAGIVFIYCGHCFLLLLFESLELDALMVFRCSAREEVVYYTI